MIWYSVVSNWYHQCWSHRCCCCYCDFHWKCCGGRVAALYCFAMQCHYHPHNCLLFDSVFLRLTLSLSEVRILNAYFTIWPNLLSICVCNVYLEYIFEMAFFRTQSVILSFHWFICFGIKCTKDGWVCMYIVHTIHTHGWIWCMHVCVCVCVRWLSQQIESMSNYGRAKSVGNSQLLFFFFFSYEAITHVYL